MPLPANANNNKESFRLLDLSSDLDSDDLQLDIAPSKKKKFQRRSRHVARITVTDGSTSVSKARWGESVRFAGYAAALAWLVVLTYAAAALHERLTNLDVRLQTVSTSSDSVSGALQLCHSAAKELRGNTSSLSERLARLSAAHEALADNFTRTAAELRALQDKLAAAPELADTPRRLGELSQTVAEFGSRLGVFDESLKSAHEAAQVAAKGLDDLRREFNASAAAANATAAERAVAAERLKALSDGIVGLNATIETRLKATEKRLNEYQTQLTSEAASLAELLARTTAPSPTLPTTTQKQPPNSVPTAAPSAGPIPAAAAAPVPVAAPTAASTALTTTPGATKPPILQSRA